MFGMNQNFGFQFGGYGQPQHRQQASYQANLKVYPVAYAGRDDLNKGNKILLPPSVLARCLGVNIQGPMIFCVNNIHTGQSTNVGVEEFTAMEGTVYVPMWIFKNLICQEGQEITVILQKNVPKGIFVKVQAHKATFLELPDHRAVLETAFRKFTCITKGDTININGFGKQFDLDILEIKPANNLNCICLINVDVEVDFAAPLNYKDPKRKAKKGQGFKGQEEQIIQPGSSDCLIILQFLVKQWKGGVRLDGKKITKKMISKLIKIDKQEVYNPREHRLQHGIRQNITQYFGGGGKKLKILQKQKMTMTKQSKTTKTRQSKRR